MSRSCPDAVVKSIRAPGMAIAARSWPGGGATVDGMRGLGDEYAAAYEDLLGVLVKAGHLDRRSAYVAMWPMRGCRYDGTLVIGRAVNDWDEDTAWRLSDAATPRGRKRVASRTRVVSEPDTRCPMTWVTESWGAERGQYSTKTSAFWRTVFAATGAAEASCWPCTVAWSNLFKVAPKGGGNPPAADRKAMLDGSARLLRMELEALLPQRVLVLAGRSWFEPFERPLGLHVDWARGGLVEGVASQRGATWVIAPHPQGKNESALSDRVRRQFACTR